MNYFFKGWASGQPVRAFDEVPISRKILDAQWLDRVMEDVGRFTKLLKKKFQKRPPSD